MKNASEYVVDDFDVNDRPKAAEDDTVLHGWNIPSDNAGGAFATDFKFTNDPQIVGFVSDTPIVYKEHWLSSKTSGKRSYKCLNVKSKPGVSCPLCEMDANIPGQLAKTKISLTIVNFSTGVFERQLMTGARRLSDVLGAMDANKALGPLKGKYWAVNKSGERQTIAYHISPVKERDLNEDWNIDIDEAKAFYAEAEAYPASIIKTYTHAELSEIAASLS